MVRSPWTMDGSMEPCVISIGSSGKVLASRATVARTFLSRAIGLLGRRGLSDGEAMVFPRCNSIHTLGMRFPIDAVFVDREWRVVALRSALGSGRMVWPVPGAWGVIELACGTLERIGVQVGDSLRVAMEPKLV